MNFDAVNDHDAGDDTGVGFDLTSELERQRHHPRMQRPAPLSPVLPSRSASANKQSSVGQVPPLNFYTQMMSMMQKMTDRLTNNQSEKKIKITDIFLPSYDPDGEINVRDWCNHINTAKAKYGFEDFELRMKVASLLKGRAKKWADRWLVTTNSWSELEQNLILTFEPENRYSRDVLRFREHTYDTSKDLSEFLSTSWFLWKKLTKDKLSEKDAVEAVIGTVDDERLRIELLNARASSVPELISVATSIRRKRPASVTPSTVPVKKTRASDYKRDTARGISKFCNNCKKPGHVTDDCYYKNKSTSASSDDVAQPGSSSRIVRSQTLTSSDLRSNTHQNPSNGSKSCSFCNGKGHTYEFCFKRLKNITSNVNFLGQPKLNLIDVKFGNQNFKALFDTGADCSVMKESIADKLSGSRSHNTTYLKGIGFPVLSVQSLNTTCTISNINIDSTFHILPDNDLSVDIILGMNLLTNTGLTVVINEGGLELIHQNIIMHIESRNPHFEQLQTDLTKDDEKDQVRILLNKFEHLFIRGYPKKRVNTGELEIRLKNPNKYVERRPYRLNPFEREKVSKIVRELLENGIARESKSPFSSPSILVKKKNGEDRLCVDFRELNANTIRDHYPLPLISDQIDQLSDGYYFSSLDMAAGFHQIPISESSIEKTAFITPDGLYEYMTMPFGLSNAPSVYQRCINKALCHLIGKVVQVYVDDVLCKSSDFTQGLAGLEQTLLALEAAGFSLNIDKCSFFKRSVEYLGNIIEDGKVRPSPRKVEALAKSPVPTTVKQVRQFNGLAGYFRRFIPNFARTMIPLYALTKQGAKWHWSYDQEEARNKIITHLTSAPVLTIFRENSEVELHTDASSMGFGAVLTQNINGRQHAVAYWSQRTTDAESRYHSYELEMLAVVRAIKHFRHFLYGRKFKLVTDCNSLKASKSKQDLLPRIHRWWAFLQHYDFDIEYRKGERLQHADFFSRNPINATVNLMNNDLNWLKAEQYRDPKLRPLIDQLRNGGHNEDFTLDENVLKRIHKTNNIIGPQKLIVVPQGFQWSLINSFHTAMKHLSWEKTLHKIRENYWFDKMNTIVKIFIDNCFICRSSKGPSGAVQAELHPIMKPTAAFQVVHIDITGRLSTSNDQYVIVSIDAYSKYVLLYHANDKSQYSTLAALKQLVHLFGAPGQIIVDGDRAFLGEFQKYCNSFGIEIHSIAPGVSRANGQVERIMSTLKNALTIIKNYETEEWHTALGGLQIALNSAVHKTTGFSPLTILTGRQHCVPPELRNLVNIEEKRIDTTALQHYVQHRMTEAAIKWKQRFDASKARIKPFQRGDYVLLKNNPRNQTSLDLKYNGPYEVHRVLDNHRYTLRRVDGRGRPKKVAHDQLRRAPLPGQQLTVSADIHANDVNNESEETNTSLQSFRPPVDVSQDADSEATQTASEFPVSGSSTDTATETFEDIDEQNTK